MKITSESEEKKNDDIDICSIPCSLEPSHLSTLTNLNLRGCNLEELPPAITLYATNLKQLDISDNPRLTTLPPELVNLKKLEILFASNCPGITNLPTVLGKMTSITRLGWKSGSLTSVPHESIPPNVVHLILTNNAIQNLDDELIFNKLTFVRKLMLSHNSIASINEKGVAMMQNLELLRLSGNDLSVLPETLWSLPKLSWLTVSGNPRLNLPSLGSQVPIVDLSTLEFPSEDDPNYSLGQGASGMVVRATYRSQEVAVKRIHSVTSDGRPEDELKSYGALGEIAIQERMVGALALLHDDTEAHGESGIIMERLPGGLTDLAQPPTIVEVTADRWDDNEKFNMSFIANVLKDISRASYYLHYNVGLVHGDMYAHNIKVDKSTGRAYLLDLGASYAPPAKDRKKAEMLEVRAFGVLMGELLDRYDNDSKDARRESKKDWDDLSLLRDKCLVQDVLERPSFQDIVSKLSTVEA